MRMRKLFIVVLAAVAAVSCGGEEVSEDEVEIAAPTSSCSRAFEAASSEESGDVGGSDNHNDTAALGRLNGTLLDCDGFDDWMAGARDFPEALPAQMDRLTALRMLCDSSGGEAPACQELGEVGDQG
ncbi:MAG: hypothetical protein R3320_02200 [Nitriliruptorales bacterium]|nr:hypothetical protein [Nitriliruptorales bacterium]